MNIKQYLSEQSKNSKMTDLFLSSKSIRADVGFGVKLHSAHCPEEGELKNWLIQTLHSNGKSFDAKTPYTDFMFEVDGISIRGHALFPPLTPFLEVSLRFLRSQKTETDWCTDPYYAYLCEKLKEGKTILLSGSTGSGKTTLLKTLLSELPSHLRILALEDTPELSLDHPGYLSLRTREANADGYGEIKLKDLLRQTLRMRPDRIVLGECRGDEVLELLQVLNTGHQGSIATLHANSTRESIRRIELLSMMHPKGSTMPIRAIRELIYSGVQMIAHLKRDSEGQRRINEVSALTGMEGDILLLKDIRL